MLVVNAKFGEESKELLMKRRKIVMMTLNLLLSLDLCLVINQHWSGNVHCNV